MQDVNVNAVPLLLSPLQAIFKTLRFTCDGNVTQLIYRTTPTFVIGDGSSEWFQFWREDSNNSNISYALAPSPSRQTETLYRSINEDASVRSLEVNIPIQANDFLGVAQLVVGTLLYFEGTGEHDAQTNFIRPWPSPTFDIQDGDNVPFIPFITAVVSGWYYTPQ